MHKDYRCIPSKLAWLLVIIGGLNWGLIGLGYFYSRVTGNANAANWNLVDLLLHKWLSIEMLVYVLVGAAAIYIIFGCRCRGCKQGCEKCRVKMAPPAAPRNPSMQGM